MKQLAHHRNAAQHHHHIRSRLERLEVTVHLCVPVELELRIQVRHRLLVTLESVEQHAEHQHPQIGTTIHLATTQHRLDRLDDMVAIEEIGKQSTASDFGDGTLLRIGFPLVNKSIRLKYLMYCFILLLPSSVT